MRNLLPKNYDPTRYARYQEFYDAGCAQPGYELLSVFQKETVQTIEQMLQMRSQYPDTNNKTWEKMKYKIIKTKTTVYLYGVVKERDMQNALEAS